MEPNLNRIKKRLALMEIDGVNGLLLDLLTEAKEDQSYGKPIGDAFDMVQLIQRLKAGYTIMVKALTPVDPSQQNLFNEK